MNGFFLVVSSANEVANTSFAYVVCTNKAIVTDPPVYEQIAPVVGKNTTVVLFQNGIGIEQEFRERFPENTIISGVVSVHDYQRRFTLSGDIDFCDTLGLDLCKSTIAWHHRCRFDLFSKLNLC